MNIIIIEDEPIAAEHLHNMLIQCNPDIKVLAILDTIQSAVLWFNTNPHPPLIFMDIHLGDGLCFEIFKQVNITSFIIFTTAYDQYAIQAFKQNSIDYLLKPIQINHVSGALKKYQTFNSAPHNANSFTQIINAFQQQAQYKERFVVKVGSHIRMVQNTEIAYFYSLDKATYLATNDGKNYLIDYTLDKLQPILNPAIFYRINRKHIIALHAISELVSLGPLRLKVKLHTHVSDEMLVSRDRIKAFKQWLEG